MVRAIGTIIKIYCMLIISRVELIRIEEGMSIVSPYPCLLVHDDTLLFSDTHLGLEEHRERLGIHIPYPITEYVIDCIVNPVKELACKRVIILGDVKHEFGRPSNDEWYSLKRLVYLLRKNGAELEVVRGNHDNYIVYILKELNVRIHDPYLIDRGMLLVHGHNSIDTQIMKDNDVRCIVLGHEHPSIVLKDDVGTKHRFKAFLYGRVEYDKSNVSIMVLPSLSPLAYGNPLNENPIIKSPILREYNSMLDEFIPYIIDVGVTVKRFPAMKYLRYTIAT
jgi:putative SbcD/Mre11-related phosphoesterase